MGKYRNLKFCLLLLFFFIIAFRLYSQDSIIEVFPTDNPGNKKLKTLIWTESAIILSSYAAFYYLWYDDYDKSNFHFFNDGKEWYGIDKCGHSFSTYWLSRANSKAFQWAGLNHTKSVVIGSISSFIFMSSIEIHDGFSKEWGASGWDLVANASGAALFLSQELTLKKQVVTLKYSYYPSEYSKYRPDLLGKNFAEKLVKDYNATTFWLSLDMNTLVSKKIPPWLNLAIGYGATGMTGGNENYYSPDCNCKPIPDSERAAQYYLSFDVDLSKIKVRSKFLKGLFFALNCIKFPGPTLEYSKKQWQLLIR